jgi:hypothetical protein
MDSIEKIAQDLELLKRRVRAIQGASAPSLPAGTALQHLENNGTTWAAVDDLALPHGERTIAVEAGAGSHWLNLVGHTSTTEEGGGVAIASGPAAPGNHQGGIVRVWPAKGGDATAQENGGEGGSVSIIAGIGGDGGGFGWSGYGGTVFIRGGASGTGAQNFTRDAGSVQLAGGQSVPGSGGADGWVQSMSKLQIMSAAFIQSGTAAERNGISPAVGDIWLTTDGGAGTTLYVCQSAGVWAAK